MSQNKAQAISADLLEVNLKNKLEKMGKKQKAGRKKHQKNGRNWMRLKETGRNRKKQEETGRKT